MVSNEGWPHSRHDRGQCLGLSSNRVLSTTVSALKYYPATFALIARIFGGVIVSAVCEAISSLRGGLLCFVPRNRKRRSSQ